MMRRNGFIPVFLLVAFCGMANAQSAPSSSNPPAPAAQAVATPLPAAETTATDAGKSAAPSAAAASLSPQQQRYLDQASQLLDLAQKLKAEVDKTDQHTLSLNTLRRADDIEKLAKSLEKQIQKENH